MSRPSIELFEPHEVGERSWGRELLIAHTDHYIGKLLFIKSGHAGGLQYHVEKDESFFLHTGAVRVDYDGGEGLVSFELEPGQTVHVPPGAPHRVTALEDSMLFEVSTPHFNDRVRCEADYGEPETGGLPTTR